MNTTDRRLTTELDRIAQTMPTGQVSFDEVRRRADRSRRRPAVIAVAATVLAITIPIGVAQVFDSATPDNPAVTATATPTPTPTAAPTTVDLDSLPVDRPPAVPLYAHGTIDGVPVELPRGAYVQAVARHGSGWVVAYRLHDRKNPTPSEGSFTDASLAFVDADGTIIRTQHPHDPGNDMALSIASARDGSVAYLNAAGQLQLDGPSGQPLQTWDLRIPDSVGPVRVTDDHHVVLLGGWADVYVAAPSGDITAAELFDTSLDTSTEPSPGLVFPSPADTRTGGSCWGVHVPSEDMTTWIGCSWPWLGLSPDTTVLARIENPETAPRIVMTDTATGRVIADVTLTSGRALIGEDFAEQYAWEDDSHLLLGVFSDSTGWQIVRISTRGVVTRADTPDLGRERSFTYLVGFALGR